TRTIGHAELRRVYLRPPRVQAGRDTPHHRAGPYDATRRIGHAELRRACLRPPRVQAGLEVAATMTRRRKFIVGGLVIAGALAYMIYAGVTQSAVYFVTPGELRAAAVPGKADRLGGIGVPGCLPR